VWSCRYRLLECLALVFTRWHCGKSRDKLTFKQRYGQKRAFQGPRTWREPIGVSVELEVETFALASELHGRRGEPA
jgi:hypothetical protein